MLRDLLQKIFGTRKKGPVRTYACPSCGEPVKVGALACRSCGSDADTGWSEDADVGATDFGPALDDFDYDEYLKREAQTQSPSWGWVGKRTVWPLVLVIVLGLLMLLTWR